MWLCDVGPATEFDGDNEVFRFLLSIAGDELMAAFKENYLI